MVPLISSRAVPNHLPKTKPAINAKGDKKPAKKTHIIVPIKNIETNKAKFLSFKLKK